jgi:hypothetical protein
LIEKRWVIIKTKRSLKTVSKVFQAALALTFGFLVVFSVAPAPVQAVNHTIVAAYPDLGAAAREFQLNGDASAQSGYLRLTRNEIGLWGSAFSVDKVTMPSNFAFNAYFTFQIIPGPPQADGMVFVIQQSANVPSGGGGDTLGTLGIYPMFGVEFDTYQNTTFGDPSDNYIAIIHGISPNGVGNADHTLAGQGTPVALNKTTQVNLADGAVHHCWIEYDGTNVHVRISNNNSRSAATEYLNQAYNIPGLFTTNDIHFGFTAGTGLYHEEHRILSTYFNNDNDLGGIDTSQNSYSSGPVAQELGPAPRHVSPTLPQLKPAQMSLQYLSVNPQQTSANQPVTIATNVVNAGDEAGNLNVALKINGQVEQARMVSVGPQVAQPVKFTVTKSQPGTYTVDVGGQKSSFTILGAGGTTSTHSSGGLIVLVVMTVLILAAAVVLMMSFRRTA